MCANCGRMFQSVWGPARLICDACLEQLRQTLERQHQWLRARFEERARLNTARFKVQTGKLTEWPGFVTQPTGVAYGHALTEMLTILGHGYTQLQGGSNGWTEGGDVNGR